MKTYISNITAYAFLIAAFAGLAFPFFQADAQAPYGGFIGATYSGVCTAVVPSAVPVYVVGIPSGPFVYIPGSVVFPNGPPAIGGKGSVGWSAGFVPCLFWSVCGISPCMLPFPAHAGGLIFIVSGTS